MGNGKEGYTIKEMLSMLNGSVKEMNDKLDKIQDKVLETAYRVSALEDRFLKVVEKTEFEPVKKIAYGLIAALSTIIISVLLYVMYGGGF